MTEGRVTGHYQPIFVLQISNVRSLSICGGRSGKFSKLLNYLLIWRKWFLMLDVIPVKEISSHDCSWSKNADGINTLIIADELDIIREQVCQKLHKYPNDKVITSPYESAYESASDNSAHFGFTMTALFSMLRNIGMVKGRNNRTSPVSASNLSVPSSRSA